MNQTIHDLFDFVEVLCWSGLLRLKNRCRRLSWESPLIISMAGIGDLLLATPMIKKVSEISGRPNPCSQ